MSENIEQKCGDVRDELLRDAISATQAWQSEAERKGKALAEVEKRIAKLEALLHSWNREAANAGFAGSEYYNEPKNVFARVRQLKQSHGEALKRRVFAERERDALAAALSTHGKCIQCGGTGSYETVVGMDEDGEIQTEEAQCECRGVDPQAILAARLAEERKAGKVKERERVMKLVRAYQHDGADVCCDAFLDCQLTRLTAQIERGEEK